MPGERQHRAVRQVLLDLVSEGPVELPQHDADAWIEVSREKGGMQIEVVVGRQCEDRDCVTHPGAVEAFATVRARRGNKDRAYVLHGAPQIRIPAPEHDHPMSLQRAKLLGRAERDRTTADDDHDRIARLSHRCLPQSSAMQGSAG